jgi:hypothetical protein
MATVWNEFPTSADPTGQCPRCGKIAHFTENATHTLCLDDQNNVRERVTILSCAGCSGAVVVVENHTRQGAWEPVHWWPLISISSMAEDDVSDKVLSCFDEGLRAVAVQAPRSAAVMFRAALAELVKDKGSPEAKSKGSLNAKLKQMCADGSLHPSIAEWAEEIKVLGNVGAHPDDRGDVTNEEARELARLTRHLIEFVYEVPARISRARAKRTAT